MTNKIRVRLILDGCNSFDQIREAICTHLEILDILEENGYRTYSPVSPEGDFIISGPDEED